LNNEDLKILLVIKYIMMKHKIYFPLALILFLFIGLSTFTGCREKYIVGIIPVYTEESRHDQNLTIEERLNIEEGYHAAVRESRRYNKTVAPLYLECKKFAFGFTDCSNALNPYEGWKKIVRQFYAEYYFHKKKDIKEFMVMNGINLLIMSTYIKNLQKQTYDIELRVVKFIPGSDESIVERRDKFSVNNFQDYERLRLMSKEALMRIMDKIERANLS